MIGIVGASGSNGRLAVDYALSRGLRVRAGTRSPARLSPRENLEIVRADALTDELGALIDGCDQLILAHGDDARPENNYRIIANAVRLAPRHIPIALMSAISVTQDIPPFQEVLDWRRRGERLLRASRDNYTIVRPGWFDGHDPGDERAVLEQGDREPLRGMRGVARRHIAEALVNAVLSEQASRRTIELFSAPGTALDPAGWTAAYSATHPDPAESLDGVHDRPGLPWEQEPTAVRTEFSRAQQGFL